MLMKPAHYCGEKVAFLQQFLDEKAELKKHTTTKFSYCSLVPEKYWVHKRKNRSTCYAPELLCNRLSKYNGWTQ